MNNKSKSNINSFGVGMKIFDPRFDKPYRYEFKYQVPTYLKPAMEAEFMRMGFKDDPFMNEGKFYHVNSVYFDTFDYGDYFDKVGGYMKRKKVRARIYQEYLTENSPGVWLEIKHKDNVRIFKEKTLITREQWKEFPNLNSNGDAVLSKILYYIFKEHRRPTVMVKYKRRIFLYDLAGFDCRFTFDYDIETCQSGNFSYNTATNRVVPGYFVLEVKFEKFLPAWFDFIVKKYNLKRDTFSKYSLSVDTVRRFNPVPR